MKTIRLRFSIAQETFLNKINILLTALILLLFNSCGNGNKSGNEEGGPRVEIDSGHLNIQDYIASVTPGGYTNPADYYRTLPDLAVSQIPVSVGGPIVIGRGVKLNNAFDMILENDKLVNVSFLDVSNNAKFQDGAEIKLVNGEIPKTKIPTSVVTSKKTWEYYEDKTATEIAQTLYANFSYDGLLASFDLCYNFISKKKSNEIFLMALAQESLTDVKLPIGTEINPQATERLKKIEGLEPEEMKQKFFDNYGSHYIAEVNYGYRIVFYATSKETSSEVINQAKVEFNSMIAKLKVEGKQEEYFNNNNIKINATVIGGYGSPGIFLRSIGEIKSFFDNLNSGKDTMYYAPISFRLKSYSSLIFSSEYPKLYSILKANAGDRAKSDFGVPKGTIISWCPPELPTLKKDNISLNDIVPTGWLLCDGTNGTPDLTNRFVIGGKNMGKINTTFGDSLHKHNVSGETGYEIKHNGDLNGMMASGSNCRYHSHKLSGTAEKRKQHTAIRVFSLFDEDLGTCLRYSSNRTVQSKSFG